MDLLDDIYQFKVNFPQEHSSFLEGKGGVPTVIWREPEPRTFRGIQYGGRELTRKHFGDYDDTIKKLDLTEPMSPSPYYQFSFKSIRIFRTCPRMFYYNVILGLKRNGLTEIIMFPKRPFMLETSSIATWKGTVLVIH
jgi:hypothetical protein